MNANNPGALYQNICFTTGEPIGWTFAHRARNGGANPQVANFEIATPSGTVIQTLASQSTPINGGWRVNSGRQIYNGPTGLQRIQFRTTNPGSLGNFLDAIQIDLVGYAEFANAATSSAEGAASPAVPAIRVTGKIDVPTRIPVTISGGTATQGTDFTLARPYVEIPVGNYSATPFPLPLTIVNDAAIEANETIIFRLGTPNTDEIFLANPNCSGAPLLQTTHTILDDDTDLKTVKSLASASASPAEGDTVSFRIAVTNAGSRAATAASLTDMLPTGLTFLSSTPSSGTYNSTTGLWTIGTIAPGATAVLTLNGRVNPGQNGTVLTNTTSAAVGTNVDTTRTDGDDLNEAVTVNATPGLAIVKTGTLDRGSDGVVSVGDVITYRFTVTNTGNSTVSGIVVTDPLPGVVISGGPITLAAGRSDSTTFRATYAITQADIDNGRVNNIATASGTSAPNTPVSGSGTSTTPLEQTRGLTVVKTQVGGPSTATAAGQTLSYRIVATNTGNTTQTGVTAIDTLPDASSQTLSGAVESGAANGRMEPGETWTWTLAYTVSQADIDGGASLVNSVLVSTDQSPPTSDDAITPVTRNPAFTVDKSVDRSTIGAPGTLNYTIAVRNTGNASLTNVVISDTLPNGAPGSVSGPSGDIDGDAVLDVGETWTFTASYSATQSDIDAGTSLTNAVSVKVAQLQVTATDTATTAIVRTPALSVVKTANLATISAPGPIAYTIRVANSGNVPLTGIAVSDILPDGGAAVLSGPSGDAGVAGTLDVGETWTYTTSFNVTQAMIDAGTALTNRARATSTQTGVGNPKESTATTAIEASPAFTTLKTVDKATISAPGPLTYTVRLTNTGNVALTGIAPVDTLPDGSAGNLGTPTESGAANGMLDVGETWTYTLVYNVSQAEIEAGADLVNTVSVTSTQTPSPQDSAVTSVAQYRSLSIDKTVDRSVVTAAGEVLNYVVTLRNTGNVPLAGVSIIDDTLSNGTVIPLTATGGDTNGNTLLDLNEQWSFAGSYSVVQADINAATNLVNRVTATATGIPSNVTDTATTAVTQAPRLVVAKDVDRDSIFEPGPLNYTIRVRNTGNVDLTDIALDDRMNGQLLTLTGPTGDGGTANVLDVDEEWVFTATYNVTQADMDAGVALENLVEVRARHPGGDELETDSATTAVAQVRGFSTEKLVDRTSISSPGTLNYEIRIRNTGSVSLSGVAVNDTLPDGTPGVLGPRTGDGATPDVLDVGETWIIPVSFVVSQARIDQSATDPSQVDLVNTVAVSIPGVGTQTATAQTRIVATPAFTVTKVVDRATISAPGPLNYVITVHNTGNIGLTGIAAIDTLPGGAPTPLSGPSGDGGTPGVLDVGETWVFNTALNVSQSQIDAGAPLINSVDVSATEAPTPRQATASTTIDSAPALRVSKIVDRSSTAVPERLTYTITATNTGNRSLASVALADTLSNGGAATIGTPQESLPGGQAGIIDVGESWTWTATYDVTQNDIDAGAAITNTAAITTNLTPSESASATTLIDALADLEVEKDVDQSFVDRPGPLLYTIRVTNKGNQRLSGVVLTDTLSNGASVTLSGPTENMPTGTPAILDVGETWVWTGAYSVTSADLNSGDDLTNTASVTAALPSGGTITRSDDAATRMLQSGGLELVKTGALASGTQPKAGDTVIYNFTVRNTGNVTLSNINLSDPMPGLVLTGSPIASLAAGATDTSVTGTYALTQADIDAGGVRNVAMATGSTPNDTPLTAGATEDVALAPVAALFLEKTGAIDDGGDGRIDVGDTIAYSFVVRNTGDVTVTGVAIADALPGVTVAGGPIASLAPGAEDRTTFTATYRVTQADIDAGQVVNSATASGADTAGGTVTGNGGFTLTLDRAAALTLVKTGVLNDGGNGRADVGDTIAYSFVVRNTGNATLTNVTLTDPLPGLTLSGGPIASLAPGAEDSTSFTATYTLTQADIDTGQVVNTATASGVDTAGARIDAVSENRTALPALPAIEVTKTAVLSVDLATPNVANVDDVITYTVTARNTGNITFENLVFLDSFMGGAPRTLDCTPQQLAPNETATCTAYDHIVTIDDTNGGPTLDNAVSVEARGVGGIGGVVQATDSTTTPVAPDETELQVTKTAAPGSVKIGDLVRYTVTIRNMGDTPARDATLIDTPPAGFTLVDNSLSVKDADGQFRLAGLRPIRVDQIDIPVGEQAVVTYLLRVGAGVRPGEHVNHAQAFDGSLQSNIAAARVRLAGDPVLDESLIIGTVFHDRDGDGWQDDGEPGIAGVRIASVEGVIVETDQFGRYHLLGVDGGPWERGRNFILKIDTATLPPGSRFTTPNPLVRRVTPGLPVRFDFGVGLPDQEVRP